MAIALVRGVSKIQPLKRLARASKILAQPAKLQNRTAVLANLKDVGC